MTEQPNNELAINGEHEDDGTLEVFPPARPPDMGAIATLREHVGAMRDAIWLAENVFCYTDIVPARFRGKPKDAAAAILFGAEIGLTPVAALRSIIVIHGQPGFEARTMKAILKSHGYRFRTIEKSATRAEIECTSPNGLEVETAAWTIEDAVQAGYVPIKNAHGKWETNANGKLKGNMKYIETPKVMLDAKATAEVCRSIAPHLLLGLPYSAEELETEDLRDASMRPGEDDEQRPARRAKGVNALRDRARAARKPAEEPVDAEEVPAPEEGYSPPSDPNWTPPGRYMDPKPAAVQEATAAAIGGAVASPAFESAIHEAAIAMGVAKSEPVPDVPQPTDDPAPADTDDGTDEAQAAGEADLEMTTDVRNKGLGMMHGLLINGGILDPNDSWSAVTEVLAKRPGAVYRPINRDSDLLNVELKFVVDTLRAWKVQGNLTEWLGEASNNAALREAGLLFPDAAEEA